MSDIRSEITILIADDDADDRFLIHDALRDCNVQNQVLFVEDGEELTDYLNRIGKYSDPNNSPRPGLILLDLNMPRKDGIEALKEIKSNPHLRSIPIVILSTSRADEDISRAYDLGANSFISKPVSYDGLVEAMTSLKLFWLQVVQVPRDSDA